MLIAGREVSAYELMHSGGARWYWDSRYLTEAETQQALLSPAVLAEIEVALDYRYTQWKQASKPKPVNLDLWQDAAS